jgi:choline dehydrogenase-like flavoprotein
MLALEFPCYLSGSVLFGRKRAGAGDRNRQRDDCPGAPDRWAGGTVHYGAVSWRFHEDDFRARSHTIDRYGASAIPQDSSLADWPLSYADLEPHYDRAEHELGVSGKAGNVEGNKLDGGNVFEAPRRREYPLPPLRDDQSGVVFRGAAKKLGYPDTFLEPPAQRRSRLMPKP